MKTLLFRVINYKGIESFEHRPGVINGLRGGNGEGKTSLLDAIRSVAVGGSEPEAVRHGATEATIQLAIEVEPGDHPDYQPGRYEIIRKIKRDGYGLTVKNPKGVKIPREKTFVEAFLPRIGFDPIAFDEMTDEQRATELEKFMRVPVTQQEIRKAAALVELPPMTADVFPDGIAQIDLIDAGLEQQASEARAEVKNLGGSIATFEKALEGSNEEDVKAELIATRKALAKLKTALDTETHLVGNAALDRDAEIDAEAKAALGEVTVWWEKEMQALNEIRVGRIEAIQKKETEALKESAKKIANLVEETIRPLEKEITETEGKLDVLGAKAERAAKLSGERQQLQAWRDLRVKRGEQLESITIARKQLDALRMRKLETQELEDLKTINGKLYLDGTLSSEVNSARRIMKWVEVATKFSEIPGQLIIVDELEKLDDDNLKIFEDAIRASGMQLFGARLDPDGGPLRVEETLLAT